MHALYILDVVFHVLFIIMFGLQFYYLRMDRVVKNCSSQNKNFENDILSVQKFTFAHALHLCALLFMRYFATHEKIKQEKEEEEEKLRQAQSEHEQQLAAEDEKADQQSESD